MSKIIEMIKLNQEKQKAKRRKNKDRLKQLILNNNELIKLLKQSRDRQFRNRAEANTVEFRIGFTRRHFSGFVQFFSKIIRPIFVNTRKNESEAN
jgi:hypothetical protein